MRIPPLPVIARVRRGVIIYAGSRIRQQRLALRMRPPKLAPSHNRRRNNLQPLARKLARYRLAADLLPPRLRLPIPHQQIAKPQIARNPEIQRPPVQLPSERNRAIAQRAIGNRHGDAAHNIVHNLMPHHNRQRIRPRLPLNLYRHHRIVVRNMPRIRRRRKPRLIYRRYPIARLARRHNLARRHGQPVEISPPAPAYVRRQFIPARINLRRCNRPNILRQLIATRNNL